MNHNVDPRLRLFKNFVYFLWKELNLPDPTPTQYDIAEFLQSSVRRKMVQAFRGVGKSWLTAAYVLWRLYLNPNERVLVVSASKDRSDAFSVFTKRLIEEVEWLNFLKPDPSKGQRDSTLAFDVGPSEAHQAPSVRSVGITGQLTGGRATLIVADDIETPKNSLTMLMRERLGELVKEFDAILLPEGEIVYLGTPQCEDSLYNKLPERGYSVKIWPAQVPDKKWLEHYESSLTPFMQKVVATRRPGDAVDPDRFDNADLAERALSYGRSGYAMQFMLDTQLSDENRFPLKLRDLVVMSVGSMAPLKVVWGANPETRLQTPVVGLKGDAWYRPAYVHKDFVEFSGAVMFIDPSGRGDDETTYAVVKIANSTLYLTKCGGFREGYTDDVLKQLAKVAKEQEVKLIQVEPHFGDGMFAQLFAPHLKAIYPCAIEDGPRWNTQKEARIISVLEPVMNQHRLVVCEDVVKADLAVEDPYRQLFYQMTRLTKEKGALKHDDRLDAVAGAVHYWIASLARSVDEAADAALEEARKRELENFMESVLGTSKQPQVPLSVADEYTIG